MSFILIFSKFFFTFDNISILLLEIMFNIKTL